MAVAYMLAGHAGGVAHPDRRRGAGARLYGTAARRRAGAFKRRLEEGRGRLTLIASEIARFAATVLVDYAAAVRKIKDTRIQPEAVQDAAQQLQRLVGALSPRRRGRNCSTSRAT